MDIQGTTQRARLWNNIHPIFTAPMYAATCPLSLNVTVFILIGNRLCNKKKYT